MDQRLVALTDWLAHETPINAQRIEPASQDASFRRYFRVFSKAKQFVVMDAPPETERTQPFIDIAEQLKALGLHAPAIYQSNKQQGFILLEDLGTRTYLDELREPDEFHEHTNKLYSDAIDAVIILQTSVEKQGKYHPPKYDAEMLQQEMDLFRHWYLAKHLEVKLNESSHSIWLQTQQFLTSNCLQQPQTWVHRDYHSRNLMITNDNSPGIIDFQDMTLGPIAYDLASLLKDCYIEWPREQQLKWLKQYHDKLNLVLGEQTFTLEQLIRWFDLTGLQRHLKVLGIFCRLNYRDGKANYLDDLPLAAHYVLDVLPRYPELDAFDTHFRRLIERSI